MLPLTLTCRLGEFLDGSLHIMMKIGSNLRVFLDRGFRVCGGVCAFFVPVSVFCTVRYKFIPYIAFFVQLYIRFIPILRFLYN